MNLPNLFIIGVYKSGSTSLHKYLTYHPEIDSGLVKETHYLDKYVYKELNDNQITNNDYSSFFPDSNSQYIIDSSPSYFYGNTKLTNYIKENCKNPKLIVILRNPTNRFISYYRHIKMKGLIEDSLEEFYIKSCENFIYSDQLRIGHYKNSLLEGIYGLFIEKWIDTFNNDFKIIYTEELISNPRKILIDISDWLEIDSKIYESYSFPIENKTINPRFKTFHSMINKLNIKNLIPNIFFEDLREIYRFLNNKKDFSNESYLIKKIDDFYSQYNKSLFAKLNQHNKW